MLLMHSSRRKCARVVCLTLSRSLSAIALVYVWRQRGSGTTLGAFKKTFLGAQDCEMIWSTGGLGKTLGLSKTFLGAQDCEMTRSTRGLGKTLGLLMTFFLGAQDCKMTWSIRDLGENLGAFLRPSFGPKHGKPSGPQRGF